MTKILGIVFSCLVSISLYASERPKLLVVIVIDQFRADYLMRFQDKFMPARGKNQDVGGFNYLMTKGAYFPLGQYDLSQSITAPGHATILSGSYPYQSGIPMNSWYDREKHKVVESTEDDGFPVVGPQEPNTIPGTSPRNLVSTTLGDELKNAGYPSRVVSLALKERSAVLLGGHRADIALWFNAQSHQWISSQYYLPLHKLPDWVANLNRELKPHLGEVVDWKLESKDSGYSAEDAMPLATNAARIGGKSFPHQAKIGDSGVLALPFGLKVTRLAAEKAMDAYQLGRGKSTDILAISFSSHDMLGHAFGPNSREMEEMTFNEDREISQLLNFIRKKMPHGLRDVVIALTGDHGVTPTPEWAQAQKFIAGRIDEKELAGRANSHLTQKYGKPSQGEWVLNANSFNIYLNRKSIADKKLKLADVEFEAKSVLKQDPRIFYVATSEELENGIFPPGIHERQIRHSYYPPRSGELILLPKPYYMSGNSATTSHSSGYSYDRTVPIILAGYNIRSGIYATRAEVVDIAPTLSFILGVVPPSLSEGRVLSEIVEK